MKFGKHLDRVIGFTNPEWSPFWMNYKLLKKLIKDLPVKVHDNALKTSNMNAIRKNPNEIIFFKHLHAEFEKVSSFFAKAKKELRIRYDRIRVSRRIFSHPGPKMVEDKWSRIGRSAHRLHNDLLLFETFAIMNYCAFSKILKKHDKKTAYETKMAFMKNVVNRSNFATYPDILVMIQECEVLYDQVSQRAMCEENHNLREDERRFIGMVHKINMRELATKDDDALNNGSCSQADVPAVIPVVTNALVTKAPVGLDMLLQDLLNIKRVRSVSEHSIPSSSSTFSGENKLKNKDTGAVLNCISKVQYRSKKHW